MSLRSGGTLGKIIALIAVPVACYCSPLSSDAERFLHYVTMFDGGAYTIFSTKPMTYIPIYQGACLMDGGCSMAIRMGWEDFKRDELCRDGSFAWRAEEPRSGFLEITLINCDSFLTCVERHISTFKNKLGINSAKEVLDQWIASKHPIQDVLGGDEILLGILLGFGEHNAEFYIERSNLIDIFWYAPPPFLRLYETPKELPVFLQKKPRRARSILDEVLSYPKAEQFMGRRAYETLIGLGVDGAAKKFLELESFVASHDDIDLLFSPVYPVGFVADTRDLGTQDLMEHYRREWGRLCSLLREGAIDKVCKKLKES